MRAVTIVWRFITEQNYIIILTVELLFGDNIFARFLYTETFYADL